MIRLLYIGIGKNVPTFIDRKIRQLLERKDVDLKIVIEEGIPTSYPDQALVRLVNTASIRLIKYMVLAVVRWKLVLKLMKYKGSASVMSRFKWAIKMLPLSGLGEVDVVHTQWVSYAAEYAWLRDIYGCSIITSARGGQVTFQPLLDETKRELMMKAFESCDFIICVSRQISEQCASWGVDKMKLKTVYNGVDVSLFRSPDNRIAGSVLRLISVGALIWRKGYAYQLLLVKLLLEQGLEVELSIVGKGHDGDMLRYTAVRLGIADRINFLGHKTPQEVVTCLQLADVYLSTSVAEGLANSAVEAAATGLPAVVFDCEGMKEIIDDNRTGYVLPFGDIYGMRDRVALLATDVERRARMGIEARAKAVSDFDEIDCIENLVSAYLDIMASKKT